MERLLLSPIFLALFAFVCAATGTEDIVSEITSMNAGDGSQEYYVNAGSKPFTTLKAKFSFDRETCSLPGTRICLCYKTADLAIHRLDNHDCVGDASICLWLDDYRQSTFGVQFAPFLGPRPFRSSVADVWRPERMHLYQRMDPNEWLKRNEIGFELQMNEDRVFMRYPENVEDTWKNPGQGTKHQHFGRYASPPSMYFYCDEWSEDCKKPRKTWNNKFYRMRFVAYPLQCNAKITFLTKEKLANVREVHLRKLNVKKIFTREEYAAYNRSQQVLSNTEAPNAILEDSSTKQAGNRTQAPTITRHPPPKPDPTTTNPSVEHPDFDELIQSNPNVLPAERLTMPLMFFSIWLGFTLGYFIMLYALWDRCLCYRGIDPEVEETMTISMDRISGGKDEEDVVKTVPIEQMTKTEHSNQPSFPSKEGGNVTALKSVFMKTSLNPVSTYLGQPAQNADISKTGKTTSKPRTPRSEKTGWLGFKPRTPRTPARSPPKSEKTYKQKVSKTSSAGWTSKDMKTITKTHMSKMEAVSFNPRKETKASNVSKTVLTSSTGKTPKDTKTVTKTNVSKTGVTGSSTARTPRRTSKVSQTGVTASSTAKTPRRTSKDSYTGLESSTTAKTSRASRTGSTGSRSRSNSSNKKANFVLMANSSNKKKPWTLVKAPVDPNYFSASEKSEHTKSDEEMDILHIKKLKVTKSEPQRTPGPARDSDNKKKKLEELRKNYAMKKNKRQKEWEAKTLKNSNSTPKKRFSRKRSVSSHHRNQEETIKHRTPDSSTAVETSAELNTAIHDFEEFGHYLPTEVSHASRVSRASRSSSVSNVELQPCTTQESAQVTDLSSLPDTKSYIMKTAIEPTNKLSNSSLKQESSSNALVSKTGSATSKRKRWNRDRPVLYRQMAALTALYVLACFCTAWMFLFILGQILEDEKVQLFAKVE
ncbi:hypothetical protein L596_022033 [Steinernema carpocapsae]|uniref:Uncharacterized protein n=1 Tax=Steinernema carpocapsae TaxID=34508 RepID=A0A4U5MKK3_STECR|nr:hypothetical protein L596_022033 [Steinernema carpocapsae]